MKYPTDAGLASHGVRALAREGRKLATLVGEKKRRVRDRSRAMGRTVAGDRPARSVAARGRRRPRCSKLTAQTGELLEQSITETRRLAAIARRRARGRGAKAKLKAAAQLEQLADRCEKVAAADHAARRRASRSRTGSCRCSTRTPGRSARASSASPTSSGTSRSSAEVTENTKRGARGLIVPASTAIGQPGRGHAAARDRRRAEAARDLAARGRARRRLQRRPDQRGARRPGARAGVHRRPPTTRLQTHPATAAALPNRRRGSDQPPQTPLRPGPQPPQGRRRPADLDRMGDPRLQR